MTTAAQMWRLHWTHAILTGVATLVFTAAVLAYARYGGPWVNGLDAQVGEVVAAQATKLAENGLTTEAIQTYQDALQVPFDDPFQRIVAANRLCDLLLAAQRYEEVIQTARDTMALDSEAWRPYDQLYKAYMALRRFPEAVDIAEAWSALANLKQQEDHMNWSRQSLDQARRALNANP